MTRHLSVWRGLLAFVVVVVVALPVLFEAAILLVPARTPDGHPVMPIGQAAFAIVFAPVLAAVTAYFAARPRR